MPVSPRTAYALLHAFGMLEFTLKRMPGFLTADGDPLIRRARAKANWSALDNAVAALGRPEFVDRVSAPTKAQLLGGARDRPQVQFVKVEGNNVWRAEYQDSALPKDDALALVHAMRRVRNNLFHGGKEDPLEERKAGDDEAWATAALEVADLLLELLDTHRLKPI